LHEVRRITKREARVFLLRAHDLLGPKMRGVEGAVARVVNHLRAVQVDPLDVAGRNHDIALASRIEGYRPEQLDRFLYEERGAFEYWLKCLCVLPISGMPFYRRRMRQCGRWLDSLAEDHGDTVKGMLRQISVNGPMSSSDFDDDRKCRGGWKNRQRLAKRVLETLWDAGVLMIHHRGGRQRYYELKERCVAPDGPAMSGGEYERRAVLDICSAMRLVAIKDRPSQAWYSIGQSRAGAELVREGALVPVEVEGSGRPYHVLSEDLPTLDCLRAPRRKYARLLAPLDSMLWDRETSRDIFDFECLFEVYKPPKQRKYGYYCLPVLYGTDIVGRCDVARARGTGTMAVKSVWWEEGFAPAGEFLAELAEALGEHARFAGMEGVSLRGARFEGRKVLEGMM
jgi:uncharacterized protein